MSGKLCINRGGSTIELFHMIEIAQKRTLTPQMFDICGRLEEKHQKDKGRAEESRGTPSLGGS